MVEGFTHVYAEIDTQANQAGYRHRFDGAKIPGQMQISKLL
jgi:hypothetical protein